MPRSGVESELPPPAPKLQFCHWLRGGRASLLNTQGNKYILTEKCFIKTLFTDFQAVLPLNLTPGGRYMKWFSHLNMEHLFLPSNLGILGISGFWERMFSCYIWVNYIKKKFTLFPGLLMWKSCCLYVKNQNVQWKPWSWLTLVCANAVVTNQAGVAI